MKVVNKYSLKVIAEQEIELPAGAAIVYLAEQRNEPRLWIEVDPEQQVLERRTFVTYATGHPFPGDGLRYVGSYQLDNGNFVGHVYERATGIWDPLPHFEQ